MKRHRLQLQEKKKSLIPYPKSHYTKKEEEEVLELKLNRKRPKHLHID